MTSPILKNILLDLSAGVSPEIVAKDYTLSNDKVNEIILYYFNGKSGDQLISMTANNTDKNNLTDKDKNIISELNNIGMNKFEIADVIMKSIAIIDEFLKKEETKEKMAMVERSIDKIKTNDEYIEKVILKNNSIEVCAFPDDKHTESTRISIFSSKDQYHNALNLNTEALEDLISEFIDNNFNKNVSNINTYNELFRFYTDYVHISPKFSTTLVKVLYKKKVNFVILYFNTETKMYHYHWIWNFNDNKITVFDNFLKTGDVYVHGNHSDDFAKVKDAYGVRISDENNKHEHHFFLDYEECFKYYGKRSLEAHLTDTRCKMIIRHFMCNGLFMKSKGLLANSSF